MSPKRAGGTLTKLFDEGVKGTFPASVPVSVDHLTGTEVV
jgi:hypothetical protein